MKKDYIVNWIKEYFKENAGPDTYAVIGISGGKDSSVVAALCVEALGRDRVFGVLMPQGQQADIDVSLDLVEYLGIDHITVNIGQAVRDIKHEIKPQLGDNWSKQTAMNIPARMRMVSLYAVAQTIGGRVANTCNKSEDYVGWATKFGDGAGDFSPLSHYTVAEVKEIGYECGLPARFIEKTPIDGLCGSTDEEALGFTYETLDRYIMNGEEPAPEIKEKIDRMNEYNLHKLRPIAACPNPNKHVLNY